MILMGKNKKPVVSIIVPCFNQGKFILETLESVSRQTFTNFECIVVNDGSTDDSLVKMKSFCEDDTRFHYIDKFNTSESGQIYPAARCRRQDCRYLSGEDGGLHRAAS